MSKLLDKENKLSWKVYKKIKNNFEKKSDQKGIEVYIKLYVFFFMAIYSTFFTLVSI